MSEHAARRNYDHPRLGGLSNYRQQSFGQNVCSESVGCKIGLYVTLDQLPLIYHTASVVHQNVQLSVRLEETFAEFINLFWLRNIQE